MREISEKAATTYYETVGKNADGKVEIGAVKLLDNLIPQNLDGKIVLDLGCGNGRHSEIFCERGAKKVVAMDLSASMLEQAKTRKNEKHLSQVELVQADMNDLAVAENKFDFIFSSFSLMFSGKMKEVVKRLGESLSEGGEFLAAVSVATIQDQEQHVHLKEEPIPLILTIGDKAVELENFAYSMDEYLHAFENAGLEVEVVEQFPADFLVVEKSYPNRDRIRFTHGIFKTRKK